MEISVSNASMITRTELKASLLRNNYCLGEFAALLDRPRLIAFGAGNAFLGLQASIDLPFCAVVDDTEGYAGKSIAGLPILSSADLVGERKDDLCVIICANTPQAIVRMSDRLRGLGLTYGEHFIDCPLLHQVSMSLELEKRFSIRTPGDSLALVHSLSKAVAIPNHSTVCGTWLFIELLRASGDGCVAECGAYKGANSLIALAASAKLRSCRYQLFDSFEGFGDFSKNDPKSRRSDFSDADYRVVQEMLAVFPKVEVIKGYFEDTLPLLPPAEYSVVYVDCDLELPARFCFEYFWDKVQPNGFMLVHDYWFPGPSEGLRALDNWGGIRHAVDDFFATSTDVAIFPETSHVAIRKPVP